MIVELEVHGGLKECFQTGKMEVSEGTTVEALFVQLSDRYPESARLLKSSLVAVNEEIVKKDYRLNANERLHIMPPFSGG